LPDDWVLPDEWARWARESHKGVDVKTEAERFRDYWIAQPGQKGVKLDWFATWRNWIRRAAERIPRGQQRVLREFPA